MSDLPRCQQCKALTEQRNRAVRALARVVGWSDKTFRDAEGVLEEDWARAVLDQ